jgi:electron transport complex protein RnfD
MWNVVVALTPAVIMANYFFGSQAAFVMALAVASALAAELACLWLRKKPLAHALDGSAAVTGLLLAMLLPASAPWYCPVVGSAFAVAIAKHCFGGLGHNVWNPALAGRIFLQFSYPVKISLSQWPVPRLLFGGAETYGVDALTQPSPLFKEAVSAYDPLDLFLGNGVTGCLGETCKLALLVGGLYLIARRCVDWRVPLIYIATVFALIAVLPASEPADPSAAPLPWWINNPLYHVLSGALFLGAFFMATDMATTPVTRAGRMIFAAGCGVLVAVIRLYGGYPEGVAFSIVIMNTTTPLIDRWVRPRIYGSKTRKPAPRTV